MTGKLLLVLVVALFAPPTAGQLASETREPAPQAPPRSIPNLAAGDLAPSAVKGGGLHVDASS